MSEEITLKFQPDNVYRSVKVPIVNPPTLSETVRDLFEFIDKEVDLKGAKNTQLRKLQNAVEAIVYQEKKHATTQCGMRKVIRKKVLKQKA